MDWSDHSAYLCKRITEQHIKRSDDINPILLMNCPHIGKDKQTRQMCGVDRGILEVAMCAKLNMLCWTNNQAKHHQSTQA